MPRLGRYFLPDQPQHLIQRGTIGRQGSCAMRTARPISPGCWRRPASTAA
jgi:hypothetical protein